MSRLENVQGVLAALSEAQKSVVRVQTTLTTAHPLAAQIPMYEKLNKIVTELRTMMVDAPKLPL